MAEETLRQIPDYVQRFDEVFSTESPTFDDALRALAAFEPTINSRNVPFDNYLRGNHSIRGCTLALKAYSPDTPTRDRLKTPLLQSQRRVDACVVGRCV